MSLEHGVVKLSEEKGGKSGERKKPLKMAKIWLAVGFFFFFSLPFVFRISLG